MNQWTEFPTNCESLSGNYTSRLQLNYTYFNKIVKLSNATFTKIDVTVESHLAGLSLPNGSYEANVTFRSINDSFKFTIIKSGHIDCQLNLIFQCNNLNVTRTIDLSCMDNWRMLTVALDNQSYELKVVHSIML